MKTNMDDHEIFNEVAKRLFNDRSISQPLYCPEVRTEAEGERLSEQLPLIYVWNENPTTGSCSISVNGAVISRALESYLPRRDPRFEGIRGTLLNLFKEIALPAVLKTCEEMQAMPSVAFSREMYQLAVKEASQSED